MNKAAGNDSSTSDRSAMMFNITPSTGVFLDLLVTELKPKRILELGTSNGYSTLWLARAANRIGSRVDTVDISSLEKADLASDNLAKCGLLEAVTFMSEIVENISVGAIPISMIWSSWTQTEPHMSSGQKI